MVRGISWRKTKNGHGRQNISTHYSHVPTRNSQTYREEQTKAPIGECSSMPSNTVNVFCRLRPPNERERESETLPLRGIHELQDSTIVAEKVDDNVVCMKMGIGVQQFKYTHIFGSVDSQASVYRRTARHLIPGLLCGVNASVMAYGQSGSGKTYTMFGSTFEIGERRAVFPESDDLATQMGIIPRAMDDLFYQIQLASTESTRFDVALSFIQIYNESVTDLIVPETGPLKVRQRQGGAWYVKSSSVPVSMTKDVMIQIEHGLKNRITKSTCLNDVSSRSHAILRISVTKHDLLNGSTYRAQIDFCDLAGSENASKSMASSTTLREAGYINKSLLYLREVIDYLGTRRKNSGFRHLIYRNSNLTKLLYESLGGNSNSILLLNVSPHVYHATETLATLRFGSTAQKIVNFVVPQKLVTGKDLKQACRRAKHRIEAQNFLIRKKSKEVRRNRALIMEVLSQVDRSSELYAQLCFRVPRILQQNAPANRYWGKQLLPEVLFLRVLSFAGCSTSVSSIFVCKDWHQLLTDDGETGRFWSALGKSEEILEAVTRQKIIEYTMKEYREKMEAARKRFESELNTFRACNALSLTPAGTVIPIAH